MKLYKYYPDASDSIYSLQNGYVWQGKYSSFNDPFDGQIFQTPKLQKLSFSKENVLCLSETNDNVLMWSHYAGGHTGFCIEFTDCKDEELDAYKAKYGLPSDAPNDKLPTVRNAHPVQYKSSKELEDYIGDVPAADSDFDAYYQKLNEAEKRALCEKIQLTTFMKLEDWKYEKEYRIVNTKSNIGCFPGNLTGIYYGIKMSSRAKRAIGMFLDKMYGRQCVQYQMFRDDGKLSLKHRYFDPLKDLNGLNLRF